MSQYTIYRNKSLKSKEQYPYFIDIKNELLSDIDSRVIMPITQLSHKNSQIEILAPVIEIDNQKYVVMTKSITTVAKSKLRTVDIVCVRPEIHTAIVSAMDMIISGI